MFGVWTKWVPFMGSNLLGHITFAANKPFCPSVSHSKPYIVLALDGKAEGCRIESYPRQVATGRGNMFHCGDLSKQDEAKSHHPICLTENKGRW